MTRAGDPLNPVFRLEELSLPSVSGLTYGSTHVDQLTGTRR